MHVYLFVAEDFSGELSESNEGNLKWIKDESLMDLELWEGDRVFMPWLEEEGFFSAKLVYDGESLAEHKVTFHK